MRPIAARHAAALGAITLAGGCGLLAGYDFDNYRAGASTSSGSGGNGSSTGSSSTTGTGGADGGPPPSCAGSGTDGAPCSGGGVCLAQVCRGAVSWIRPFGGSSYSGGLTIAVNPLNHDVFVGGRFRGTLSLPNQINQNAADTMNHDAFVARIGADGTPKWVKGFGGAREDEVTSLAFDGNGNVAVAGVFRETVDFGGGPRTYNAGTGLGSLFLVLLDGDGNYLWDVTASSPGADDAFPSTFTGNPEIDRSAAPLVLAAAPDQLALVGRFAGSMSAQVKGVAAGNTLMTGTDPWQLFLASINAADGSILWAKGYAGTGKVVPNAAAVDAAGRVKVTGSYSGSVNFMGASSCSLLPSGSAANHVFVAAFDATTTGQGACQWGARFASTGTSGESAHAADLSGGNLLIAGDYNAADPANPLELATLSLPSDGGVNAVFAGTIQDPGTAAGWASGFGGPAAIAHAMGVAALPAGKGAALVGTYVDGDFQPFGFPGVHPTYRAFILGLNASGAPLWGHAIAGGSVDQYAFAVAGDAPGFYVTGASGGTASVLYDAGALDAADTLTHGYVMFLSP